MESTTIKYKIISYIKFAYEWHEKGEPSMEYGAGQNMVELEEEILTAFGLPFMAFQYSEILQLEGFSNKNIEKRAEKIFNKLTQIAIDYLLAPIEKDEKVLLEAKRVLKEVVEVLPMIGITATNYNNFLYYDKFFRDILEVTEFLELIKKAEQLDNFIETRIPSTYEAILKENTYQKLIDKGLPFIDEYRDYLHYKDTKHNFDKFTSNYDLGDYFGLPDVIHLKHFVISHIHLKNQSTCVIRIIIEHGDIFIELTIWCTPETMQVLMLHAKYYSLAIAPLYIINCSRKADNENKMILKQCIQNNVEIHNIHIELERLDDEDDEIINPFDYTITSINTNEYLPIIHFDELGDELPF